MSCCCCLLLGVGAPTHTVEPYTRYTKHKAEAKAQITQFFIFYFALLLCYCITHGPPVNWLYISAP